jgi:hypothetical protein
MAKKVGFQVIDFSLKRCASRVTDASYGKCVRDVVRTSAALRLPEQPVIQESFISKGSPLITKDIEGNVIDGQGLRKRPCVPSDPKGNISPCRTELDFPSPRDIEEYNLPLGTRAVIRRCDKKNSPGYLVPVSSPNEALQVSKAFCDCVGGKVSRRAKCARGK